MSFASLVVHIPHVRGFSFVEELRKLCISLEAEPGPCSKAMLLSWLVSVSPHFPDYQLFESAFWDTGKVLNVESTPCKQGAEGPEKLLCP